MGKEGLIIASFLFLIFFVNFVSAGILISEANVSYDSDLVKAFEDRNYADNLIQQDDFIGLQIIDNEVWARVRVVLKDNSRVTVEGTKEERRNLVDQRLKWFEPITNDVIKDLKESEFKEIKIRSEGFSALMSKEGLNKISKDERIKEIIWSQYKPELNLLESAELINADNVWSSGYTGNNVHICIIDTGIDKNHDALPNIVAEQCYCADNCCPGGLSGTNNATDEEGHGTRVAGVISSQDLFNHGIAHDADLYIVRVTDENGEYSSDAFADIGNAIDWCRTQGVDVISMSFRSGPYAASSCPVEDLDVDINNAFNSDITLVAGSGNDAEENKIGYPACNSQVISVGGSYDIGNGSIEVDWCEATDGTRILGVCFGSTYDCFDYPDVDSFACWSNRNPNLNLLAPGYQITTTALGGGFTSDGVGTSLSTPMVAGAAALLLEKDPTLTPDEIKYTLQLTGVDVYDSETGLTFKRIDVEAALNNICTTTNWTLAGGCG